MKKIMFIVVLFFTSIISAQNLLEVCQTSGYSTYKQELENIRGLDHTDDIFYMNIYVHILRHESEPKGGQTIEGINRLIKFLYEDFDPLGIFFVWNGDIDYIDNDQFSDDPDYYSSPNVTPNIFDTNNHNDGIDIYLIEDRNPGFIRADDIGGSSFIYGGWYDGQLVGGHITPISWYKFISHAMGHCLYLWHTHHGTFNEGTGNECPELVNGNLDNRRHCGDFIADTPADPNIGGMANLLTCEYEGGGVDANGDPYQPDTSNLMSFTYPTCMSGFTTLQKTRMKNAIWYLPVLNNMITDNYTYIRPINNCFVCYVDTQFFKIYSTVDISQLSVISSENISTQIISTTNNSLTLEVSNLLDPANEGERGYFTIVRTASGAVFTEATQSIWVGKPQTVPDNTINGDIEASAGQLVNHKIGDGFLRIDGIDYYDWDFPEPNESFDFIAGPPPNNPDIWEYNYISRWIPIVSSSAGSDTGIVTVRGVNPCGLGDNGNFNELCVLNSDDNDGDPDCSTPPQPIIYYPNPANSLLDIDLSLQEYQIYTVTIYDENQIVHYNDQSTNIVKTVDVANLTNGTYYLHIYDAVNDLILSAILIINH